MAERARRVGVGETHALGGEAVDVRGRDLRLRVVGAQVAVAHVIDEDDDDVRGAGGQGRAGRGYRQQREQQVAESWQEGRDDLRGMGTRSFPTASRRPHAPDPSSSVSAASAQSARSGLFVGFSHGNHSQ